MDKQDKIETLKKQLEKTLDEKRYAHTIGVAYTAASLAMRYEEDMNNALLAGLLHDCAKYMSHEKRVAYCKKYHVEISDSEYKNPSLLHAKAGSIMAKEQYGIKDEAIAKAILYHTTGHPNMTLLEKIIFIADYIEPMRDHDKELPQIRKMAFEDLDKSLKMILKNTLEYLKESSQEIDPMTEKTYEYYK